MAQTCEVKGCGEPSIGRISNRFESQVVCEKHAWPALQNAQPGEKAYGINIGWERWEDEPTDVCALGWDLGRSVA